MCEEKDVCMGRIQVTQVVKDLGVKLGLSKTLPRWAQVAERNCRRVEQRHGLSDAVKRVPTSRTHRRGEAPVECASGVEVKVSASW